MPVQASPLLKKAAKEHNIPVIIYCDIHHFIQSNYSVVKVVDSGFQSVDMYVMNETKEGDIIVSQDYVWLQYVYLRKRK